ncbi:MAG: Chaperone protein DnaK, partial [uncultured Thiotrichaceae bacterium]
GIETMGGVSTKLINKNSTIPTKESQTFSTADDNQTAVTVHVLQGEREMARDNKSLGRFDLQDIPPAPRGMPQIEVTFDIDANGILNVSAKDKATGKEQSIVIKASSGLSDDEVERMVQDAEAHAEDDKKQRELVDTRNQAESLIHGTEKSLKEYGDKVDSADRANLENLMSELKDAVKGDNKDIIERKSEALGEASGQLMQKMAGTGAGPEAAAAAAAGAAGATGAESATKAEDDDIVDAEFEEVDNDKKK